MPSKGLVAAVLGPLLVRRADVAHVYQGPATLAMPALALRALRGIPYVYDVQDLWPDSLSASGMATGGRLLGAVAWWCGVAYRHASRITVLSPGLKDELVRRDVPADKVDVIYNWCEESQVRPVAPDPQLRRELGFEGRFVVMFAGTMGAPQGLDAAIDAAALLHGATPDVLVAFVGSGIEAPRLQRRMEELSLANVVFLPRQPVGEGWSMMSLKERP